MGDIVPFPARAGSDPWVHIDQVANHFGVTRRTVERWMRDGLKHDEAATRKFGKARRFRLAAVEDYFERKGKEAS